MAKKKGSKKPTKKELEKIAEVDGLEFFFGGKDNFILAGDEEAEGNYPGNQNNAVLIPKKREVVHGKKS